MFASICGFVIWRVVFFFFQAEDGIRVLVRSRGLGDVYKRQIWNRTRSFFGPEHSPNTERPGVMHDCSPFSNKCVCLLYTSDAADDLLCVDLGGRRIIKKKNNQIHQQLSQIIISARLTTNYILALASFLSSM